ncbi:hypothetical protein Q9L58_005841 [Maublancomyces gigas]|uniref:Uncharacterized protein n=1 Tax=Discina gigas TaxID=1032678 RepID=A0ABR3GH01_9PEZI
MARTPTERNIHPYTDGENSGNWPKENDKGKNGRNGGRREAGTGIENGGRCAHPMPIKQHKVLIRGGYANGDLIRIVGGLREVAGGAVKGNVLWRSRRNVYLEAKSGANVETVRINRELFCDWRTYKGNY